MSSSSMFTSSSSVPSGRSVGSSTMIRPLRTGAQRACTERSLTPGRATAKSSLHSTIRARVLHLGLVIPTVALYSHSTPRRSHDPAQIQCEVRPRCPATRALDLCQDRLSPAETPRSFAA
jgi:hypothetical protein